MAPTTSSSPADTSSEEEIPEKGESFDGGDGGDYGYNEPTESERQRVKISRRTNVTAEAAPFDISYRPGRVLLYSPPRQRQRWNDTQVLPRVNWGDLFFDLFYVAATYNVSNIVVNSPDRVGLLYAAGTFLPVMNIWATKTFFDGRFVTESDLYHRFVNILLMVILAVAVLHIRPVDIMSDPSNDPSIFVFSFMLIMDRILWSIQSLELYFFGVGQKAVKTMSTRELIFTNICLPFYVAATVLAARDFCDDGEKTAGGDGGDLRFLAASSAKGDETTYVDASSNSFGDGYYHASDTTNVPIILCLAGFLVGLFIFGFNVICCFPGGGRHKEQVVPVNIDFVIHRNGEWTMLMLGESVFSLLIVDVSNEGNSFYTVFYCGILTVIFLQLLHFQSQPHDADSHAMRRSKNAGVVWNWFQYVYSFALVMLGAAFTFFLVLSDDVEYYGERRRRLAGTASPFTEEEVGKAADLFCGSLAIIFCSLEAMSFLHVGFNESQERCVLQGGKNYTGILLLAIKVGVILFTGTLSQWKTEPKTLSIVGLCTVAFQLVMRKLGSKFLSHSYTHGACKKDGFTAEKPIAAKDEPLSDRATGEAEWPNVTHARADSAAAEIRP